MQNGSIDSAYYGNTVFKHNKLSENYRPGHKQFGGTLAYFAITVNIEQKVNVFHRLTHICKKRGTRKPRVRILFVSIFFRQSQ